MALVPTGAGELDQALLLEVGDEAGAQSFADELTGRGTPSEPYRDVQVTTKGDVSTADVNGFLVVGAKRAVESVIDTDVGAARSLDRSDAANEVDDELPDDALVEGLRLRRGRRRPVSAPAPRWGRSSRS